MIINLELKEDTSPYYCPKTCIPHKLRVVYASKRSFGVWNLDLECVDCGVQHQECLSEVWMQKRSIDFNEIRKMAKQGE